MTKWRVYRNRSGYFVRICDSFEEALALVRYLAAADNEMFCMRRVQSPPDDYSREDSRRTCQAYLRAKVRAKNRVIEAAARLAKHPYFYDHLFPGPEYIGLCKALIDLRGAE